jgi:hypothetical protein
MVKCAFFNNKTAILLWLLCAIHLLSTAQNISVKDSSGNALLSIDVISGLIKISQSEEVIYNTRGNLVFNGNASNKEEILFMLKGTDVFSKKGGSLILNSNSQAIFTFTKGKVWLGNSIFNSSLYMGAFEKNENKTIFKLADTILLFETEAKLNAVQSIAVLAYFVATYKIDEALIEAAKTNNTNTTALGQGTIRKLWGNASNQDFIWDGKVLKNRWGFNDYEQWAFDGTNLYRANYDTGEDFVWDGQTLQRKYGADNSVFVKEGNSLRSVYSNTNEEFFIQGNIVKRAWTTIGTDEWETNGDIPVPIIMMVVFRLVR